MENTTLLAPPRDSKISSPRNVKTNNIYFQEQLNKYHYSSSYTTRFCSMFTLTLPFSANFFTIALIPSCCIFHPSRVAIHSPHRYVQLVLSFTDSQHLHSPSSVTSFISYSNVSSASHITVRHSLIHPSPLTLLYSTVSHPSLPHVLMFQHVLDKMERTASVATGSWGWSWVWFFSLSAFHYCFLFFRLYFKISFWFIHRTIVL